MPTVRAFRGLRARDDLADRIIAPPYDVLSRAEAMDIVADNPLSFLGVTRPDVALPDGADVHGPEAYDVAHRALVGFEERGELVRDGLPSLYLYSQTWQGRTQRGLVCLASTADYDAGLIKKHELTRPTKEQDRVDHIEALSAQTGLVFLAYRDGSARLRSALDAASECVPSWFVRTEDGVEHVLQRVSDPTRVQEIEAAVGDLDALYIADGHHRAAAASRVAQARHGRGTSGWFLVGLFPDSELQVMAYNRVVLDLNGHSPEAFRAAMSEHFELSEVSEAEPPARGGFTMYLGGSWTLCTPRPGVVPEDPVGCLDVAVLQDRILGPLLGIADPRRDERIKFVGGIRGAEALSGPVDTGEAAVAFHMFPTGMDQLFDVADADMLMPPKSTWFEPKLRAGVVVHTL